MRVGVQHPGPGRAGEQEPDEQQSHPVPLFLGAVADDLRQRGPVHPFRDQHVAGRAPRRRARRCRGRPRRRRRRPAALAPRACSRVPPPSGRAARQAVGRTSRPGISTENSRATRLSWVKSLSRALPAPGYWIFTATRRPSCQTAWCTWPIDAAAAGLSSNSANWSRQSGPRSCGQHPVHGARGQRRRGFLELGQRRPVRPGDFRRQRGLEDGQRLPELHRPALELSQDPEDLLGRPLLDLGGDQFGGPAADALAEPPARSGRPVRRGGWPAWRCA